MPVTYFVALPFVRTEEGNAAGQGQECPNESSAIRKAEAMSREAMPNDPGIDVTRQPRTTNRLGACVVPKVPRRLLND